jgi:NitT/TauT family transport system substrate-binding protein
MLRVCRALVLPLILFTMVFIAACGDDEESSSGQTGTEQSATESSEPTPIKVGIIPIAPMAPLQLAEAEGIFEENGVAVELAELGQVDSISALVGGEFDMVLEITGGGLRAHAEGAPIVAVYQNEVAHTEPPDSGGLVVKKDAGMSELADLAGKTIGVNSLHSQEVVSTQHLLREAGVNPGDYELTEVPFPNMPDAVKNGQVDAAVMVDPFTTISVASNIGDVVSWIYVEAVPGQPIGVFWSQKDWADENKDAVDGFAAAVSEAQDQLNADEAFAREKVAEFSGLEPDLLADMPLPGWDDEVNLDIWNDLVEMLVAEEELPEAVDPQSVLSESLKASAAG